MYQHTEACMLANTDLYLWEDGGVYKFHFNVFTSVWLD